MSVRTLKDSRWSCRGCGDCCRGFQFGPVEPEVIAHLAEQNIADHWPPAAEGPWFQARRAADGSVQHFLTHRNGHCVFLQDDARCAIHARLGEDAKPWFCREYPFLIVETSAGLVSQVRADCGGLHQSFQDGEPIGVQAAEAAALPRLVPRQRVVLETVEIVPGLGVSDRNWGELEPLVLSLLVPAPRPAAAVAMVRDRLLELARRPPARPSALNRIEVLQSIFSSLAAVAEQLRVSMASSGVAEMMENLSFFRDVCTRAHARCGDPLPLLDENTRQFFGVVLRGRILSRRFGVMGGLPSDMGLFLTEALAAQLGGTASGALTPSDVGPILARWKRVQVLPPIWSEIKRLRSEFSSLYMVV